ncbi:hypothetical protein BB559_006737 [Furculomyces boomerangus]|uniref:Uncharacterized protein n=1 Tax=Furculomyces boomerangus TaxID=61424 RepID=A0A2T9Y0V4_9FUNG|nr:hypothetical protein BB559_006737 [Furculomyces boomerangus]
MSKIATEIFLKHGKTPIQKFTEKNKSLFALLNVQYDNGIGSCVLPKEWVAKDFNDCYYEIKKVKFKINKKQPDHGKAWGIKYWRGVTDSKIIKVPGGYKKDWTLYKS